MIPAEDIRKGDVLRILAGEIIPVDGKILNGETSVDQSIMTGESLPVDKAVGDEVFCGTINRYGSIDITATKVGEDSSLQKLIRMVEEAENKQAPMQRIADRVASWLVPVGSTDCNSGLCIHQEHRDWRYCTGRVLSLRFGAGNPHCYYGGYWAGHKHGVIIKSGESLEKMGKVDTIAFDKTGTLTYGRLEISDVISFDSSLTEKELLTLTASAEDKSEHPLGKAIVAGAKEQNLPLTH